MSDKAVKLLENDGSIIDTAAERGVLKSILKTKKIDNETHYLVEWKDPSEQNEWLTASDFDDPAFLTTYWRKTKPGTKKRKSPTEEEQEEPGQVTTSQVQQSKPKRQAIQPAADSIQPGRKLEVPAFWFGNEYAKETYGNEWKKAKEKCTVMKKQGKHWSVKNHVDEDARRRYLMLPSAVQDYSTT